MPPTVLPKRGTEQAKARSGADRRSELICRIKYCNTLPDIPFDPKFITYPFESNRFVSYNPTSLEKNYKHELLTEFDLGITVDLIDPDNYILNPSAQLHPTDEKLLEEDTLAGPQDSKRSILHAKSASWLRRTEYISTEHTRFQPQHIEKIEAKVGLNVKKKFRDENIYMDRKSQIEAIDKTFEDCKVSIEQHHSKTGVEPVEILPVFPDFMLWRYPFAQVIFDSDPAPAGKSSAAQVEEMSQAMIRGVMDEKGEQFVAYFLPTDETVEKRQRDFSNEFLYTEDEEYDYKMGREYNWNVKNKASKGYEENYFMVFRNDGIYYNELETRVRLTKRRHQAEQSMSSSRLVVKHRVLNKQEMRTQKYRDKQLQPQLDEEESSEDDDEEEEEERARSENEEEKARSENEGERAGSENEDDKAKSDNEEKARSDNDDDEKARSDNEARGGSDSDESGNEERARSDNEERAGSDSDESGNEERARSDNEEERAGSGNDGERSGSDNESESSSDSDEGGARSENEGRSDDSDKDD